MAGFLLGSLVINWIFCSALNTYVEQLATDKVLRRRSAFLVLIVSIALACAVVVAIVVYGFPESTVARDHFPTQAIADTARSASWLNILFSCAYLGFQLRRYVGNEREQ